MSQDQEEPRMARYSSAAGKKVKKVMHEKKQGKLRSGRSGKKVTSRKQAIAIGLSEARKAGAKVPPAPRKRRASARKRTSSRSRPAARRQSRKKSS
jgi:hypothetical protein